MLRHQGGDHVNAGFYLNLDSWDVTTVSGQEGGTLAGDGTSRYLRVPILGMLVFAPLMGAVFAMFLPFIGIYMVAQYFLGKGWVGLRRTAQSMVMAMGPAWQPSAAHLSGAEESKKKAAPESTTREAEQTLDELERAIEERKRQ